MAFIEVVIKIPEEAYKACLKLKGELDEDNSILGICLINSVANGTLLPKGHGDIGDIGKLYFKLNDTQIEGTEGYKGLGEAKQIINEAPIIIEADKGD